MIYVNQSDQRKLVTKSMMKVWVQPGQEIDLSSNDRRVLGLNSLYIVPIEEYSAPAPVVKKPDNVAAKVVKKEAPKKTEKVVAKNVVKKNPAPKKPEMTEVEARNLLKESMLGCTKARLIEIGEEVLGVDVKTKDTKDKILKQVMKASKKKGYAWVLKHT